MALGIIISALFICALVLSLICIYVMLAYEFSHNNCIRSRELAIGTKSILFGAHCFLIHPVVIAIAWIKLYGFPFDPRIWIAFFVHDLGYWGKRDIDGEEGKDHVLLGAKIMGFLFDRDCKNADCYKRPVGYNIMDYGSPVYPFSKCHECYKWSDFTKYHSRYYAKQDNVKPSKLCIADKLAICIEPSWLYLPRVIASGEIKEFMKMAKTGGLNVKDTGDLYYNWHQSVKKYMFKWVMEHKDGKDDLWTPDKKESVNELGVLQ